MSILFGGSLFFTTHNIRSTVLFDLYNIMFVYFALYAVVVVVFLFHFSFWVHVVCFYSSRIGSLVLSCVGRSARIQTKRNIFREFIFEASKSTDDVDGNDDDDNDDGTHMKKRWEVHKELYQAYTDTSANVSWGKQLIKNMKNRMRTSARVTRTLCMNSYGFWYGWICDAFISFLSSSLTSSSFLLSLPMLLFCIAVVVVVVDRFSWMVRWIDRTAKK